jgi:uncharacterized membrane protein YfbV (UPF0208 family)
MSEIQTGIDAVENMAYEIGQQIGAIEAEWKEIQRRIEEAREIVQYMQRNPDHFTVSDIEEKAQKILEVLNGI